MLRIELYTGGNRFCVLVNVSSYIGKCRFLKILLYFSSTSIKSRMHCCFSKVKLGILQESAITYVISNVSNNAKSIPSYVCVLPGSSHQIKAFDSFRVGKRVEVGIEWDRVCKYVMLVI